MESQRAYLKAIFENAWGAATKLFFQKTWAVVIRDVVLLLVTVGTMYAFQDDLAAQKLIPPGSSPALSKIIPAVFGMGAVFGVFAVYLIIDLLFIAPYRLWAELRPSTDDPSAALVDDESKQLAGVVATLRERVMIYGFKPPVVIDDPYYQHRSILHHSTHAIWTQAAPRQARIDLLHATACLADANSKFEDRAEIDYWRKAITDSADDLIRLLLGQKAR